MFKTLYRCARTAARHESGPAAKSRLAYLEHLAAGGSTLHTLRATAGVIFRSAVYMNLDESSPVERAAVEEAARAWAHRHYRNTMAKGPEQTEREFRLVTCCWLRFAGRLQEPARAPTPHRPFTPGGLYGVVGDRMKRLKIESPRTGPHCLRHACATHLLAQGLTLTEVGGHLGHSSADSTRVYAKVDMPRLREVAELDLGGLL
jgi:hypothetical protein